MVTRQELAQQVWGSETFVDYEQGLNFAIRQIRTVLDDDASDRKFLETIPKRGYRFIGALDHPVNESPPSGESVPLAAVHPYEPTVQKGLRRYGIALLAVAVIAAMVGLGVYRLRRSTGSASADHLKSVAVLPLTNLSNDSDQEFFSDGVTDEISSRNWRNFPTCG